MDLNDYQVMARETAIYPQMGNNLWYPTLGLCGESGEVAEKIKKLYRDQGGDIFPDQKVELCKELGDVLWYVANLASELGFTLTEVAVTNLYKLRDRKNRSLLKGEGDNR